jgi:hypothetical protein
MSEKADELSIQEFIATCFAFVGLLISGTAVVLVIQKWPSMSSLDWEILSPAEIGDFIGGTLGAAFGLTGTLLFFAALLYQGSELKAQKKELRLQRDVATQQAASLRNQNDISERNALYERVFVLVDRLLVAVNDCRSNGVSEATDGSWYVRDIEAARNYDGAYQRAQAIIGLLDDSLRHACLAPEEVRRLRLFADLERLRPPAMPSELQFSKSEHVPEPVRAERDKWSEEMRKEGR